MTCLTDDEKATLIPSQSGGLSCQFQCELHAPNQLIQSSGETYALRVGIRGSKVVHIRIEIDRNPHPSILDPR